MSTEKEKKLILWFEEISKADVPIVGGKNASLGEMTKAGIPVPPGYASTAYAYKLFIEKTGIAEQIYKIIDEIVKDKNDPEQYKEASKRIRKLIDQTEIPKEIEESIREAYGKLGEKVKRDNPFVAVRSSATAEDLPDASFAGQQETFLNVKGADQVVEKTRKCWSSLFTARAMFYREEKNFRHEDVLISVGVQIMVNSKAAGVMFTLDPVSGDESQIVIEGTWGLGEKVVAGQVKPDHWVIDKNTGEIIEDKTIIRKKTERLVRVPTGGNETIAVPVELQEIPCINEDERKKLLELARKIHLHYTTHQDIEWAIDNDLPFPENVMIVQSRPETVWSKKKVEEVESTETSKELTDLPVVLKGLAAGKKGIVAGIAKIVLTPEEAKEKIKKGDILVTKMTDPDWVPYMKLAGAIVTDEGGVTAHAAIISRELGIPCIVGTDDSTKKMKTGEGYTIDGQNGVVYQGIWKPKEEEKVSVSVAQSVPATGVKIMMNLGVPEKVDEYKRLPFKGIGLMRIEFILASLIKEHPLHLIEKGEQDKFVNKLAEGVAKVARAISPRPVVVRLSDFKTNEYRGLKGGKKYEIEEENPMLGWRGCSRYWSIWYEKAFRLECKAILKCREEWGLKNIWVMVPVVRTLEDADKTNALMAEEGLVKSRDLKIWYMAETPAIVLLAEKFCEKCDGFSIGSNDMTQGILMIDRDNKRLGQMGYFDERRESVKRAIAYLIKVAHKHKCTVSICGEGPSNLPEVCEFLVRAGIDSISVANDKVVDTIQLVASIEKRMTLEKNIDDENIPEAVKWAKVASKGV